VLLERVARCVDRLDLGGRRLLVAASGGLDSTTLVQVLHELAQRFSLKLSIGHVNQGLRGADSQADQVAVERLGERLGLPVHSERIDPRGLRRGLPSRDRPTLQEAARAARYEALGRLAEVAGASRIATAHHADDQAETVLLRLLRGSGPDGLGGVPERSQDGRVVRPLLEVSRSEIERFARERRLSWREDASNGSDAYARNRLRRHWLPGLRREFNPRLLRAIADLAEAQRRDSEWIAAEVEREAASRFAREGAWLRIDARDWSELPEALARRLARAALRRGGAARLVSRPHLARVRDFLRGARTGSRIELPGGLLLIRDRAGFRLGPLPAPGTTVPGEKVEPRGAC
jgi:tRNA(Ile)-lysidine synthase